MSIEPGTVIASRYTIKRELGKGGMGEVWAAENTRTGRMVALKVLRAESKDKQSAIERFRREARAAGSIRSDFVTQVLDVDDDADHGIVLVFELLEGESLVERLKRTGPIELAELWGIVEAVWMGLCDAHEAGIIHRDLKPSNVFLAERRTGGYRVKILDFGISKLPKAISTQSLTQVGQSLGTYSFMPPEQIGKAKTVDHRADIYACATLIFQGLSGKLPYHAKNVVRMMELKNKTEPRTLSEVMPTPVPAEVEAFVARGLARDPAARFQTAHEALAEWRRLRPAGATSILDLESSGTYPSHTPAPPPSYEPFAPAAPSSRDDEVKTLLMKKPKLDANDDALPPTRRDGSGQSGQYPHPARHEVATVPDPAAAWAQSYPQQASADAYRASQPSQPSQPSSGDYYPTGEGSGDDARLSHSARSRRRPKKRGGLKMAFAMVLGAVGLMVIGFVAVALLLKVLKLR